MSEIQYEYSDRDALYHYGVLGMKWGVRKDGKPQGFQYGKSGREFKATKNLSRPGSKAETDKYYSHDKSRDPVKVIRKGESGHRKSMRQVKKDEKRGQKEGVGFARQVDEAVDSMISSTSFTSSINSAVGKARKKFGGAPITKENVKAFDRIFEEAIEKEISKHLPAGYKVFVETGGLEPGEVSLEVMTPGMSDMSSYRYDDYGLREHLKHDGDSSPIKIKLPLKVIRDTNGLIERVEITSKLKHGVMEGDGMSDQIQYEYSDRDALYHYGVLGMKWGVRKDGKPQGFQYGKKGSKSKSSSRTSNSRVSTPMGGGGGGGKGDDMDEDEKKKLMDKIGNDFAKLSVYNELEKQGKLTPEIIRNIASASPRELGAISGRTSGNKLTNWLRDKGILEDGAITSKKSTPQDTSNFKREKPAPQDTSNFKKEKPTPQDTSNFKREKPKGTKIELTPSKLREIEDLLGKVKRKR